MNIPGFKPKDSSDGLEMIHGTCGNPIHFGERAQMADIQSACELHAMICGAFTLVEEESELTASVAGVRAGEKSEGDALAEKIIDITNRCTVAGISQLEPFIEPRQRELIRSVLAAQIKTATSEAALLAMTDTRDSMMSRIRKAL